MLVLTRKLEEEIVIGDGQIRIRLISVKGGSARIGIVAPRDIRVDRAEIHEERQCRLARKVRQR